MSIVKLRLDLATHEARALMRGYLDALDRADLERALEDDPEPDPGSPEDWRRKVDAAYDDGFQDGISAPKPLPPFLRSKTELPPRQETTEGVATREGIEQPEASASLEAAATGEASPRCSGSEGADARPQQSLQAEPDLPPAGADDPELADNGALIVELLPCPFCRKPIRIKHSVNPLGTCETDGCFMAEARIGIPLDDPVQVSRWNRRAVLAEGKGRA